MVSQPQTTGRFWAIRPKPGHGSPDSSGPHSPIRHSDEEWEAVYPHIRRMYVLEGQKLRYVIDKLAREHGFKVNPQTLRKRFVQWGMHKRAGNRKQHASALQSSQASPVNPTPSFSPSDTAEIEFLSSIRTWTFSFLEGMGSEHAQPGVLMPPSGSSIYDAETLSFSFRLITSLLQQGEGLLAGLLARKTFMQVEALLSVEGPLFIWNFLEIFWYMLSHGQQQLPLMLISHLSNLAKQRYCSQHPLPVMLKSLQRLLTSNDLDPDLEFKLRVLRHGWSLNANLLFSPPDPRLLLLYYRMVWDSGLVQMPESQLLLADRLYTAIEEKVPAGSSAAVELERIVGGLHEFVTTDDSTMDEFPRLEFGRLPAHYDSLVAQSVDDIRNLNATEPDGTIHKFRALSARVKSRMWENEASVSRAAGDSPRDPLVERLNARTLAYVMRVVMEADVRRGSDTDASISRLRDVIALREYGQSPIAPQVVYELRQLESLLCSRGRFVEADEVRRDSMQRLRRYVGDIPTQIEL